MWETVKTKAEEIRVTKAKGRRNKRRSRKKARRKEEEEGKGDRSKEGSSEMGDLE